MKIGIYGGSFSPPHIGHAKLAMEFLDKMGLDRLIIVPAGNPPHKRIDGGADGTMRLEMCHAMFQPLSDKICVSDFEALRSDPCYTVDTLRHFEPMGELFMLCGSDMFLTLDSWKDPMEIFRLATVVCGARCDDPMIHSKLLMKAIEYQKYYSARCTVMDFDPIEVSSTGIRDLLGKGEKPAGITDEVYDVILKNKLYGCDGEL